MWIIGFCDGWDSFWCLGFVDDVNQLKYVHEVGKRDLRVLSLSD